MEKWPTYTVKVTVKVAAASEHRAYHVIRHTLNRGRLDEDVIYVDAETISQQPEDDDTQEDATT